MSWLHTLAANPYIVLLARRITSSSVLKGTTQTTGPSGRQGGRGERIEERAEEGEGRESEERGRGEMESKSGDE